MRKETKKETLNLAIYDKGKYINYDKFLALYPDYRYYMLWSGRLRGKSTNLLNESVMHSYENMEKFIVLYRFAQTKADMETYFNNEYCMQYLENLTGGKYNHYLLKAGRVYFSNYDDKGKEIQGPLAGYYKYLIEEFKKKSLQWDNVYRIIFEEFVTDTIYLVDEVYQFESFLSTVLRERQNDPRTKIFLVGNTLNKINPYVIKWKLFECIDFDYGDIKGYDIDVNGNLVKIFACMFHEDKDSKSIALSEKGRALQKGAWEQKECKLIKENWRKFRCRYNFIYVYAGFYFDVRLLNDENNNYFLFCSKRTTDIDEKDKNRIIGDYITFSNLYTRDFTPIVKQEQIVFNLLKQNKIFFSDKDTGTNFYFCMQQMKEDYKKY